MSNHPHRRPPLIRRLLALLLTLPLAAGFSAPAIAAPAVKIASIEIDARLLTLSPDRVRGLIPLKEGDAYSEEKLNQAREALDNLRLFESIEARARVRGTRAHLSFTLTEARLIRKVSLRGNYPFLTKKILRLSSLQPGTPFLPDKIGESQSRIREFFEKEGYFGTIVSITPEFETKKPVVNLKIRIEKGKTYRIGNVEVNGNENMRTDYIRNKMLGFGHFKVRRVKKRIKDIQQAYVRKGFVRARVRLADASLNIRTNRVDVKLEIEERSKLHLNFVGNEFFRSQTLDDYVTFYQEKGYDRFSVQRSQEKLEEFYRLNGFLNATINNTIEKADEEVAVTFHIDEGIRTRLKKIEFKGNDSFSARKLSRVMQAKRHTITQQGFFREDVLPGDIEALRRFYLENGFFDVQVRHAGTALNRFGDLATVTVEIEEGAAYGIRSVQVSGNKRFTEAGIIAKSGLKTGKRYEEKRLSRAYERIGEFYRGQGHAHFKMRVDKGIDPKAKQVDLTLHVGEGPMVRVGKVLVAGEYTTREKTIRGTVKFREGDVYTYKKILDAQLNLKRLGVFENVQVLPIGLEEERETIDVLVRVHERKRTRVDTQAGFDSDTLLSGQLIATRRNLFGRAQQLQFRGIGGFELNRGELTLFTPRLFGANWNWANQAFIQYEDDENFNAFSYGVSSGVLKYFGPNWTLLLKEQIVRFNIFEDESNQAELARNLFDSTFAETSASVAYDNRDNFADPSRGIYALASTEFDTDLADATNNFNISKLNVAHYQGFLKRFTLINNFRVGKLFRITDARIPATKLFFLGGNDTVRGFDEDAVDRSGGTTSLIYNVELHFRLVDAFKVAGFFDAGSLTEEFADISGSTFRESAGVGLRYITPVGPIRLDYGFVLDKRAGEDGQRFHFSFGYFF